MIRNPRFYFYFLRRASLWTTSPYTSHSTRRPVYLSSRLRGQRTGKEQSQHDPLSTAVQGLTERAINRQTCVASMISTPGLLHCICSAFSSSDHCVSIRTPTGPSQRPHTTPVGPASMTYKPPTTAASSRASPTPASNPEPPPPTPRASGHTDPLLSHKRRHGSRVGDLQASLESLRPGILQRHAHQGTIITVPSRRERLLQSTFRLLCFPGSKRGPGKTRGNNSPEPPWRTLDTMQKAVSCVGPRSTTLHALHEVLGISRCPAANAVLCGAYSSTPGTGPKV